MAELEREHAKVLLHPPPQFPGEGRSLGSTRS